MAKRPTWAKQKIRQAAIPYRVREPAELPSRLSGGAATVYLIFNEGYAAGGAAALVRTELATEAVRLGVPTLTELELGPSHTHPLIKPTSPSGESPKNIGKLPLSTPKPWPQSVA